MTRNLTSIQVVLILGGILLVASLFVLLVYLLHRAFERQRKKSIFIPVRPRPADEAAFATAAMQGVIAKLKAREAELNDLLREAEQSAETSSRTLEAIVREFPAGLMVFSQDGFLELSNPAVRTILGIDTWSRRRYTEILGAESPVARLVERCLESGKSCRIESVNVPVSGGPPRTLSISVSPCHGRSGQPQGAVCFVGVNNP